MSYKENETFSKIGKPLLFGQIVSYIATFLLIMLFSVIVCKMDSGDTTILVFSLICSGIGAMCGGVTIAKIIKKKGIFLGAINGLVYFIVLTAISMIVSEKSITVLTVIKLALFVICSALGGVIGVNTLSKRKIY